MLMRARRIVWMFGMVVGCGLLIAWATKRQPIALQPCPFDANISLGIAFQGPHQYFHTGKVQEKTINARIAWFRAIEQPNPDAFDKRVYQELPEEDWDWWTTLYPTRLVVQVTDAQKRLGSAEIWDSETNLLDRQLQASSDGSTIDGEFSVGRTDFFSAVSH